MLLLLNAISLLAGVTTSSPADPTASPSFSPPPTANISVGLQTSPPASDWSGLDLFSQFIVPIVAFIFVCLLAYYVTRWLSTAKFTGRGRMRITDALSVGYQKSLQVIKIGEKYFLIAVTKDRINYLTELSKDDIDAMDVGETSGANPFDKYLKQFLSKNKEHK